MFSADFGITYCTPLSPATVCTWPRSIHYYNNPFIPKLKKSNLLGGCQTFLLTFSSENLLVHQDNNISPI